MFEIIAVTILSVSIGSIAVTLAGVGKFLIFLALLSVLVVFHEFGHFVFAKRAGVTVTDFAVGFGPTLLSVRRGDTTYRLNALPLGGYCKMAGEDTADDGSSDPGNFQRKSLGARFAIIAAGPLFNLVLAVFIFAMLGGLVGIPTGRTTIVNAVMTGSEAAKAGLTPQDEIVALDGNPVRSGTEMLDYIHHHAGKIVAVDVLRSSKLVHLKILDKDTIQAGEHVGTFGFYPKEVFERKTILDAIAYGFVRVGQTAVLQFVGITDAIRNHDTSVIAGPVGIAHVVIGAEALGLWPVLELMATISVVLGLFNLLPLPALDGGRLAFLLVELIRGRPVNPEREGLVHLTGFALLMLLVAFVTYHDIVQWVHGKGGL
jgi:regulator of sigma E protease